jgi:hypothetical protein
MLRTHFQLLGETSWISGLIHRDLGAQIPEMQALLKDIPFQRSAKGKNSLSLYWPVHFLVFQIRTFICISPILG